MVYLSLENIDHNEDSPYHNKHTPSTELLYDFDFVLHRQQCPVHMPPSAWKPGGQVPILHRRNRRVHLPRLLQSHSKVCNRLPPQCPLPTPLLHQLLILSAHLLTLAPLY